VAAVPSGPNWTPLPTIPISKFKKTINSISQRNKLEKQERNDKISKNEDRT
jgi:hypothetical protein